MASRGYILIEATVGKARDVAKALKSTAGVKESYLITGPYDLIAVIEAASADAVSDVVTNNIHKTPGVARTVTCLKINVP